MLKEEPICSQDSPKLPEKQVFLPFPSCIAGFCFLLVFRVCLFTHGSLRIALAGRHALCFVIQKIGDVTAGGSL